MDLTSTWERVLVCLQRDVDPDEIDVWFGAAEPLELAPDVLRVGVPNRYHQAWVEDNYGAVLHGCVAEVLGRGVRLSIEAPDDTTDVPGGTTITTAAPRPRGHVSGLNPEFTFETFVVGECNRLAHAAAEAVCERPARAYNPLYIHGPTGLGKTHLMHAIGNEVVRRDPSARVLYVTAEDYTNEVIHAIRYKRTDELRVRYRQECTVLLVDDIQFFTGKQRTQDEFFHTFNTLQASFRQIVLTSDVEPDDIDGLEPRLRTRFGGGLVADMQPPDFETLVAILRRKADSAGTSMPDDLAIAVAESGALQSIRELEGQVHRLIAVADLEGVPLSLEWARRRMPRMFSPEPSTTTVAQIIEAVARFHNLKSADLIGQKRTRALTRPRHLAMYLARQHTTHSFPELGKEFGGRDHSTIQHGVNKVESELATNPEVAYQLRLIQQSLGLRVG